MRYEAAITTKDGHTRTTIDAPTLDEAAQTLREGRIGVPRAILRDGDRFYLLRKSGKLEEVASLRAARKLGCAALLDALTAAGVPPHMLPASKRPKTPKPRAAVPEVAVATSIRLYPHEAAGLLAHWDTASAGAQACVRSWLRQHAAVLRDLRGRFTASELKLVLDAANGLHVLDYASDLVGQHLYANVHDAIALNALDAKWGVDASRLLGALRGMHRIEAEHLERWAASFWRGDTDAEVYVRALLLPLSDDATAIVRRAQSNGGHVALDYTPEADDALRELGDAGLVAVALVEAEGKRAAVTLTERGRRLAV